MAQFSFAVAKTRYVNILSMGMGCLQWVALAQAHSVKHCDSDGWRRSPCSCIVSVLPVATRGEFLLFGIQPTSASRRPSASLFISVQVVLLAKCYCVETLSDVMNDSNVSVFFGNNIKEKMWEILSDYLNLGLTGSRWRMINGKILYLRYYSLKIVTSMNFQVFTPLTVKSIVLWDVMFTNQSIFSPL